MKTACIRKVFLIVSVIFLSSLISVFQNESIAQVIESGVDGNSYWALLEQGTTIDLEKMGGFGMRSELRVSCLTQDKSNRGHLYQNDWTVNILGWLLGQRPGGHTNKKTFSGTTIYKGFAMAGYKEFSFFAIAEGWTFVSWTVDTRCVPAFTISWDEQAANIMNDGKHIVSLPLN